MNWKTLALCAVVAGVTVSGGCGGPNNTADTGPVMTDGGAAQTRTYVIGMIDTDTDDTSQAYGFDLDSMMDGGATASGCTSAPDFTSPITGDTAVDNQLVNALSILGSMLGADGPNGAIRDQIEAGKILLMLEVSDINSFDNDSAVMVHAVLGQVQPQGPGCSAHTDMSSCMGDSANMCEFTAAACSGMTGCDAHTDMASCAADTAHACTFAAARCATTARPMASAACAAHDMGSCETDVNNACNWSVANSACTGIASGQTFALLTDLGTVPGTIVNHRLEAITTMLPLHLEAGGRSIDLTLRTVHFGGRIAADNITGGEFGAQVLVTDIIMLGTQLGFPIDMALIESVVMPDLMPDATGAHCGAISAGMAFTGISATLGH
jgi:hypothetical protein